MGGIDQFLPEYWSQLLQGCVDLSHFHHGRSGYLRRLDYLLCKAAGRTETYAINEKSDYFSASCEFERMFSFSPELVMKHQCCYLLKISSPLDFVLRLIQHILEIYEHWRGGSLHIFTPNFHRFLKSSLLTLMSIRLKLNQQLSKHFQTLENSLHSQNPSMRTLSIDLLKGEEICQDVSTMVVEEHPSMTVWCAYIDAELLGSNQGQARKVSFLFRVF